MTIIRMASLAAAMFGMASAALAQGTQTAPSAGAGEPEHIQVQHILISFAGKLPKNVTRTQDEAKKMAYDVLAKAKKGEDFDALVKQHTDDQHPGVYGMSNKGVAPAPGEYPREGMVPAFGNVGFKLKAGEVGIADYDEKTSPYGWHIIKRIR